MRTYFVDVKLADVAPDGQKLFDFCAECLKTFIETHTYVDGASEAGLIKPGNVLPLGFTVSVVFSCSVLPLTIV